MSAASDAYIAAQLGMSVERMRATHAARLAKHAANDLADADEECPDCWGTGEGSHESICCRACGGTGAAFMPRHFYEEI